MYKQFALPARPGDDQGGIRSGAGRLTARIVALRSTRQTPTGLVEPEAVLSRSD